jgi:hypothetical protein
MGTRTGFSRVKRSQDKLAYSKWANTTNEHHFIKTAIADLNVGESMRLAGWEEQIFTHKAPAKKI